MRISIRRCLSMLRNTSDGNELAMPLPMPIKECSVAVWYEDNTCVLGGAGLLATVICCSQCQYDD